MITDAPEINSSRHRRCLVTGIATAVVALLVTACAGSHPNTPVATTSQPRVNPPAAREMTRAEPQSQECTETVTIANGSVSWKGGGGMGGVSDSTIYFTCGRGPQALISLTKLANSSVTFVPYGPAEYTPCFSGIETCDADPMNPSSVLQKPPTGPPVTIEKGSSATVGPYQITVVSIDSGTAVFKVVNPSG